MKSIERVLLALVLFASGCNFHPFGPSLEDYKEGERKSIFIDIIQSHGYTAEEHIVQTDDGYLLTLHRIPRGLGQTDKKGVVFLQHGLLCSSVDWIVAGPKRGLPFLLAEQGYDVWLGNARGNTYSRRHVSLEPKSEAFWQFSWHEIGIYDLPAMIDYALNMTRQTSLHYIGYSQGTTAFLVMASMRGEYGKKVSMFQAMAPAVYLSDSRSPFIRAMAPFANHAAMIMKLLGRHEFMPNGILMETAGRLFCRQTSAVQSLCKNILFVIAGYDSDQMDSELLPKILENTPAGASVNQVIHYLQSVRTGNFSLFDYGASENKVKYGTTSPPQYPLEKVTVPTVIHYGENDWITSMKDVKKLMGKLPNIVGNFRVPFAKFNHLDFLYAKQVRELVYEKVINVLGKDTKSQEEK